MRALLEPFMIVFKSSLKKNKPRMARVGAAAREAQICNDGEIRCFE